MTTPITREWLASIGADVRDDFHSTILYRTRSPFVPDFVETMKVTLRRSDVYLNDRFIGFVGSREDLQKLLDALRAEIIPASSDVSLETN